MAEKDSTWQIVVKTGDHKGSGTDANVFVSFLDQSGERSEDIKLDVKWRNDFKRGTEEAFPCDSLSKNDKLGTPCTMELWRDNTGILEGPSWYCEVITLKTPEAELKFPVLRWVEPEYRYKIPVNDTSLPQDDPFPEQRKDELARSREKYKFDAAGLQSHPAQMDGIPEEEKFSDDALRDLTDVRKGTKIGVLVGTLDFRKMTKYEHIERLFKIESAFPKPRVAEFWNKDEWFGAQRLAGIVPMMIHLCRAIPENFAVTDAAVAPFLEGMTLEAALDKKRLFLENLTKIDGLYCKPGYYVCVPMCLFFLNKDNKLMPIAIQLYQGKHNPVFTPEDEQHKWTLVKMWFNLMESIYQQSVYHLGFTHLAMEGFLVAVHRCLNKNHPIFRLLAPHFNYLLAIKDRALSKLTASDGILNKVQVAGVRGGFQLLSRMWPDWSLDGQATLPNELESRGVADKKVLPDYPYRDDGMLVYNAIKSYVSDIVNLYYDSNKRIIDDIELQEWAKTLAGSRAEGGAGYKGVPNGGSFQKPEDIVFVCTAVIFTCSAQHATVNFGQYDIIGHILNYPISLQGQPPLDKEPITEEDVMNTLVEKRTLFETLAVGKVLSNQSNERLGDWDIRWQYDPKALEIEDKFRADLKAASEEIKKRNSQRSELYKYTYLDPENLPNAISI